MQFTMTNIIPDGLNYSPNCCQYFIHWCNHYAIRKDHMKLTNVNCCDVVAFDMHLDSGVCDLQFFFFLFCLTHSFNYLLSSPAPSGPPTNIRVIKVTSVDVDLVWKRPDFPIFASFIYTLYWGTARNELEVKPVL